MTPKGELEKGELERGYGIWEGDLYGVGSVLGEKRRKRGWQDRTLEAVGKVKEESIIELLEWRGGADGKEVFEGRLPWDNPARWIV